MFKVTKNQVLQLGIFAFAFVYRIIFMLWQTYPSGADIGVHASVINSITQPSNSNLLWNYYQMGGGVTLAFPGYHIFVSIIITMTGMPNYLAQAIIAALFSSITVLSAFLITRIIWNESVAFIAAFFMAVSRLDIEILAWGGYPNITGVLLIPLTFYLFLKRDKLKPTPFLVLTIILTASIFLTHSLSAAVFVGITAFISIAVLLFPKKLGESRKNVLYWVVPMLIGAILVSPFLANAVPTYLNESATFTDATAIEQALLAEEKVPFDIVLALFACIVAFFLVSKKFRGHFFSFPVFLLVAWLLAPLLLTQCYLVGFYIDYIRFPYFLIIPVIILGAVVTDYSARYFSKVLSAYVGLIGQNKKTNKSFITHRSRILARTNYKTVHTFVLTGLLLLTLLWVPIFLVPWEGVRIQSYYQCMNKAGYQAIEWTRQNTPVDAVFVSDHHYGWWLAGFGQRPTISSVELQCLSLAREVDISKNASLLLDTNYMIDNGYIQVREDGGYISRHNPLFLADLNWTNSPYSFFQFSSSEITFLFHDGNKVQSINVSELPVKSMQLVGAGSDSPSIVVNKANSDLSYTELITVTKGELFANMTIIVQSNKPNVSLDYGIFVTNAPGRLQQSVNNTLIIFDSAMNLCGQLIFAQTQPEISSFWLQNPCITQLSYDLKGKSEAQIQILVGIYALSESDSQNSMNVSCFSGALSANLQNLTTVPDLPITTFDYNIALQEYNISYVANRDFDLNSKFVNDPEFSLVFINNEVAIFKVETNVNRTIG
jgi:hypothetical protein